MSTSAQPNQVGTLTTFLGRSDFIRLSPAEYRAQILELTNQLSILTLELPTFGTVDDIVDSTKHHNSIKKKVIRTALVKLVNQIYDAICPDSSADMIAPLRSVMQA